jgi:hypothetical protein
VNRITLVCDTINGLTGICACTDAAQNISRKLARNVSRLMSSMRIRLTIGLA